MNYEIHHTDTVRAGIQLPAGRGDLKPQKPFKLSDALPVQFYLDGQPSLTKDR